MISDYMTQQSIDLEDMRVLTDRLADALHQKIQELQLCRKRIDIWKKAAKKYKRICSQEG